MTRYPTVRPAELRCTLCRRWLPDRHFVRNRNYPQRRGRDYYCRACKRAYRRAANPGRRPARRAVVGPGRWRCARCGNVFGADAFYWRLRPDRRTPERSSYCRDCRREQNREQKRRRYRVLAADPAARERERQRLRAYRQREQQRKAAERRRRTAWVVEQTRRHLASGWTVTTLAAALGAGRRAVACWRDGGPRCGVYRTTEERWCRFLAEQMGTQQEAWDR